MITKTETITRDYVAETYHPCYTLQYMGNNKPCDAVGCIGTMSLYGVRLWNDNDSDTQWLWKCTTCKCETWDWVSWWDSIEVNKNENH